MCSAMVLPTLGRTLFRNNESAQLSNAAVTSSATPANTMGKPEPHDFLDFCNLAASGLDVDSDVDMSGNIGQIITSLSSLHSFSTQLSRGEQTRCDPVTDGSFGADLKQLPFDEKRTCDPLWGSDMQQVTDVAASDGSVSSPDHFSDSGAEMFDADTDIKPPPLRCPPCDAISSSDDLMALHPLQPLQAGPGTVGGHDQTQTQELDIEKLMTDYLYDPEDVSTQTTRLDELAAVLARVSGLPAPAAPPATPPVMTAGRPVVPVPVSVPAPAPVPAPASAPVSVPVPEQPSVRWGGLESGSSILEGVLRGTLAAGARGVAPPKGSDADFKPAQHCFPIGGFQAYVGGADVRAPGIPLTPGFTCEASSAGSPGRMECALSPVDVSRDVFASGGVLASPPPKKDTSRKRKYAKRSPAEGEAPPSRGRLLHFCPICSKGFKDKYSVNVHVRTHTGEKPFQCELCNKCFRQKAHLAKHVHIHSSPKPPPTKR